MTIRVRGQASSEERDPEVHAPPSLGASLGGSTQHLEVCGAAVRQGALHHFYLFFSCRKSCEVLPSDLNARKSFVQSGGLQKIQEVKAEVGSKLHDYIEEINMLYPPEIVQCAGKRSISFGSNRLNRMQ